MKKHKHVLAPVFNAVFSNDNNNEDNLVDMCMFNITRAKVHRVSLFKRPENKDSESNVLRTDAGRLFQLPGTCTWAGDDERSVAKARPHSSNVQNVSEVS